MERKIIYFICIAVVLVIGSLYVYYYNNIDNREEEVITYNDGETDPNPIPDVPEEIEYLMLLYSSLPT